MLYAVVRRLDFAGLQREFGAFGDAGDVGETTAAAGCTAAGYPEAAPVCGYVGGKAAAAIWDAASSMFGDSGCSGAICGLPPPEAVKAAAFAKSPTQAAYVPALAAAAQYGRNPDEQVKNLKAGTLRRALESAMYIRIAAGLPATPVQQVGTDTQVKTAFVDHGPADCESSCREYFKSFPDRANLCPDDCKKKYAPHAVIPKTPATTTTTATASKKAAVVLATAALLGGGAWALWTWVPAVRLAFR